MRVRSEFSLSFALCCLLAACSNSSVPVAPVVGAGSSPVATAKPTGPSPTPSPAASTPTATPAGMPSGAPTGSPSASTASIANAVAASIETYWESLPHQDRRADTASVASYMQTLPVLHHVVIGDGSDTVWALLPNGSNYTYFLDRGGPYADTATGMAGSRYPAASRAPAGIVRQDANYVAPDATARQVFLTDSLSFSPVVPRDQIVPALHARGYANATYGALTVDAALGLKGSAVSMLYLSTHGGQLPADATIGRSALFGLLTTTPVTDSNDATYSSLIAPSAANGLVAQLGYASAIALGTPRYTLQTPFFASHLTLGSNAFLYFDACHTAAPDAGAQGLIATLQALSPGLAYLGWTKSVQTADADETAAFVFDRTLGESLPALFPGPPKQEDPPERPFSLEEIARYATTRSRDDGRGGVESTSCLASNVGINPVGDGCIANLVETSTLSANVALVPSLSGMAASVDGVVTMRGEFPAGSGTFSVDDGSASGSAIAPIAVAPTDASFQTSKSGPGSAGYVTYTLPGGPKSNALALTDYTGSLSYSLGFTAADSFATAPDGSPCPGGSWNSSFGGSDTFSVDAKIFLETTRDLPGATLAPNAIPTTSASFNATSTATAPQFSGTASGTSGQGQYASGGSFTGCTTASLDGNGAGAGGTPAFGSGLPINGNFLYPYFNGYIAIAPGAQPATVGLNLQLWPIGSGSGDLFSPIVPPATGTSGSVNLVRHFVLPTTYDPVAFGVGNLTHKTQGTTPDGFTYIAVDHGNETDQIDFTSKAPAFAPRRGDGR